MSGVIGESKLSSKRQISVPKAVCLFLKISPGDFVIWKIEGGRVYVGKKE